MKCYMDKNQKQSVIFDFIDSVGQTCKLVLKL